MKRHNKAKFGSKICQFGKCQKNQIEALYTSSGIVSASQREYACEEHKKQLDRNADDGHMTEADHMTWGRL